MTDDDQVCVSCRMGFSVPELKAQINHGIFSKGSPGKDLKSVKLGKQATMKKKSCRVQVSRGMQKCVKIIMEEDPVACSAGETSIMHQLPAKTSWTSQGLAVALF